MTSVFFYFCPLTIMHHLLKLSYLLLLSSLLSACSQSYEEQVITKDNIDASWFKMQSDASLTEVEKVFFESLHYLVQDRKTYLSWLQSLSNGASVEEIENIVVGEEDYNFIRDRMFTLLQDNKLTYKETRESILHATEIADIYADKLLDIYGQIDSTCKVLSDKAAAEYKYVTPEVLTGYCPFLPREHSLYKQADVLRSERDTEIEIKHPILTQLRRLESELYKQY